MLLGGLFRTVGIVLRWLLPLFAVFALLGQTVTSYAAAGTIGDPTCCCPVKAKCKCHDHDAESDSTPVLKRCAGTAKLVAPAVAVAIAAITPVIETEPRVTITPAVTHEPIPDDVSREPEKPPF